jgi:uncharacterized membrane protein
MTRRSIIYGGSSSPHSHSKATSMTLRSLYLCACSSLIVLIFLCLAWELRLAPIQPGGSWLILKCVPLLAPLFGILHGRRYTYQWASMFILLYFTEGVVRATSESGPSQWLAAGEIVLSLAFFCSSIGYIRRSRSPA